MDKEQKFYAGTVNFEYWYASYEKQYKNLNKRFGNYKRNQNPRTGKKRTKLVHI